MLVSFVIDVDSLAPDPNWSPSTLRACHHQLLDVWERIGLLVHDGERFEDSGLNRAVGNLPQNLRVLWLEMLERSPSVPCKNDWDGSVSRSFVPKLCSIAALGLVDDTRAEVEFGFTEEQDEISFTPAGAQDFTLCRLQTVQQAGVVQARFSVSHRNIETGERYQDIWSSRFRSLASAPSPLLKRITIVDRYAIERHFRPRPQDQLSGLERFLRLLDEDAGGPRYVTLYSAWTSAIADRHARDVETEMDEALRKLRDKNLKRLTIHMVPNAVFGEIARDRYVRFHRYVWELGHGLDIFEGPAASHSCQASFKSDSRSHSRIEEQLGHRTQPSKILIPRQLR